MPKQYSHQEFQRSTKITPYKQYELNQKILKHGPILLKNPYFQNKINNKAINKSL